MFSRTSLFVCLALAFPVDSPAQVAKHPPIRDVKRAFEDLNTKGTLRTYHYEGSTAGRKPEGYGWGGKSHFQGIQPIGNGYHIVSGSGKKAGHLFLLTSTQFAGLHKHAVLTIRSVTLDTGFRGATHAGGIQVLGNYLAVPLEHGKTSRVAFYAVSRIRGAQKPRYLYSLKRDFAEAGAVGITQLKTGQFLLAVGRNNSNIIDFYVSRKRHSLASDPDFQLKTTWNEKQLKTQLGRDREFGNYQSLQLLTDTAGRVYMVGMHRNTVFIRGGQDWADLFHVSLSTNRGLTVGVSSITKIAKKHMNCTKEVNFDAGAGIYVNTHGTLDACAVGHWWSGNRMWVNEFQRLAPASKAGWVQLWDDKNFKDRTLRINYSQNIPDYKNVTASRKRGFGDKVSSVKFLIPKGYKYVLYEHDNYRGRKYELIGTGKPESRSQLGSFNDKTSSSRLERAN